jgi:hypothetical protein
MEIAGKAHSKSLAVFAELVREAQGGSENREGRKEEGRRNHGTQATYLTRGNAALPCL